MHMHADVTSSSHGFRSGNIQLLAKVRSVIGKNTGTSSRLLKTPSIFLTLSDTFWFYGLRIKTFQLLCFTFLHPPLGKKYI